LQSADRSDVPNVIVLISDSASSANSLQTVATARALQLAGTKILAIGASSRINVTELQLIASPPHLQNHQWWTVNDFSGNSLRNIASDVESELCKPNYG
jgi:von Willebrand factor type A domain